jgi:Ca2+-binding RTX toxin-like protein
MDIMALFVGTPDNDTITPAMISAGVLIIPADSDLTGDDAIVALAGDDVVEGDSGTDIAALGDGNDRFIWNPGDGDDIVDGGDGTDTLEFNGSDAAELMTVTTLDDGGFRFFRDVGDITVDTTNVERIEVNALGGDDTVDGSAQTRSDVVLDIRGGAGNDSLTGGAGNDFIEGNTGDDAAFGLSGDDRFTWDPGDGDDIFDGGDGTDTLEFNGSAAPEFMTVMTLEDGGFRFFRNVGDITVDATNVEVIEANSGDGNDVIIASGQTDPSVSVVVEAGGGNDVIVGGEGNDDLAGNTGDDVAFGLSGDDRFTWDPGDGDDTFDGGDDTDTLEFNGSNAAELMTVTTLANGGFRFFRDVGDITVDTINVERVEVNALGGDDTVDGSAQTRSDVALEISGGAGNDSLTGGAGPDSFVFAEESSNGVLETDTINGYSQAEGDVIDVSNAGGVIASQVVAGNLQLTLGGGDDDIVVVQGVTNVADVTFIA